MSLWRNLIKLQPRHKRVTGVITSIAPLILALVNVFGLSADLQAQITVTIGQRPTCPTCVISLRPELTLGDPQDPAGFAPLVHVARSAKGDIAISSATFIGEVFIYDATGHLKKVVGRQGRGPGEFAHLQFLAFGPGDSLHTIDAGGSRYSIFAPDFAFARSVELGVRTLGFQLQPSGALYVVAPRQTPEGLRTLQAYAPDGTFLQAFDFPGARGSGQDTFGRHIAVDGNGTRWSIGFADYTVKQWGPDGALVRQFKARRDWVPDSIPTRVAPNQRPPGQIAGLTADSSGLLWIYALIADANWTPPASRSSYAPNRLYDTLIEVVDRAGNLVATRRVDELVFPIGGRSAYTMLEDSTGERRIQLLRLLVTGR